MTKTTCILLAALFVLLHAVPLRAGEYPPGKRGGGKPISASELPSLNLRQSLSEDLFQVEAGQFAETDILLGLGFVALAVMVCVGLYGT